MAVHYENGIKDKDKDFRKKAMIFGLGLLIRQGFLGGDPENGMFFIGGIPNRQESFFDFDGNLKVNEVMSFYQRNTVGQFLCQVFPNKSHSNSLEMIKSIFAGMNNEKWDRFWTDDPRAAYWVIHQIENGITQSNHENGMSPVFFPLTKSVNTNEPLALVNTTPAYSNQFLLPSSNNNPSHEKRVRLIENFLLMYSGNIDGDTAALISAFKSGWSLEKDCKMEVKFLKKFDDEEHADWLWKASLKVFSQYALLYDFKRSKPSDLTELKIWVQGRIDTSDRYSLANKKLMKDELGKKWAMKKYQLSKKTRSPLSVHIGEDTQKKFAEIRKHLGMNKDETTDWIIDFAYSHWKKG